MCIHANGGVSPDDAAVDDGKTVGKASVSRLFLNSFQGNRRFLRYYCQINGTNIMDFDYLCTKLSSIIAIWQI